MSLIRIVGGGLVALGLLFPAAQSLAMSPSGFNPLEDSDFPPRNEAKETLGHFLFYDKILSGNRNISCATCHHPLVGGGDALSLSVGEGGRGLGMFRDTGSETDAIHERVPRNAPHLFNLGAQEFVRMFHDGRLERDPSAPGGFVSPAGAALLPGLENPLAAQAMFPVTSAAEMAGQAGESDVSDAAVAGELTEVWRLLTERVMAIAEYRELVQAAWPDLAVPEGVTFAHLANAIGAYEAAAFRADNSPFDRYLRGERWAMSESARMGWALFRGKARCDTCHSGVLQTDHAFHAIGMPQIGPGKGDGPDGHDDFGRERVTGAQADRYRFRTPTLRNVAWTGPWGHDGAYATLEGVVRHHLDAVNALLEYDIDQAVLPSRPDLDEIDRSQLEFRYPLAYIDIAPVELSDVQVRLLLDFLYALTDQESLNVHDKTPRRVPSGLPIGD